MCLLSARHVRVLTHFNLTMFIRKYGNPIFQMPKIRLERTAITRSKAHSFDVTGSPLPPCVTGRTRICTPFIVQAGDYDMVCEHKEFPPRRSKIKQRSRKNIFHFFFFFFTNFPERRNWNLRVPVTLKQPTVMAASIGWMTGVRAGRGSGERRGLWRRPGRTSPLRAGTPLGSSHLCPAEVRAQDYQIPCLLCCRRRFVLLCFCQTKLSVPTFASLSTSLRFVNVGN